MKRLAGKWKHTAAALLAGGLLFSGGQAFAAGEPTLSWHTAFDAGGYEILEHTIQSIDGGFVGVGIDGDILKTDGDGNLIWAYRLPNLLREVKENADGTYTVVGDNGYYAKVDENGNILWAMQHTVGTDNPDFMSLQLTSDGGYILAGNVMTAPGNDDIYLMKIDADGNFLWGKSFGGAKSDLAGDDNAVQQTTDGGYIITGTTWSYSNEQYESNAWLVRTDMYGNLKWQRAFGGTKTDFGTSVQQTSDGGFVLAGRYGFSTDTDAYLVKTDGLGNLQWQRAFGGTQSDYGTSVQQTSDGGYVLGGLYRFSSTDFDMYLVKTDSLGNMQWQQAYGGAQGELATSVRQTTDGGYILGGYTESFAQYGRDYYFVRLGQAASLTADNQGLLKDIPVEKTNRELAEPTVIR